MTMELTSGGIVQHRAAVVAAPAGAKERHQRFKGVHRLRWIAKQRHFEPTAPLEPATMLVERAGTPRYGGPASAERQIRKRVNLPRLQDEAPCRLGIRAIERTPQRRIRGNISQLD